MNRLLVALLVASLSLAFPCWADNEPGPQPPLINALAGADGIGLNDWDSVAPYVANNPVSQSAPSVWTVLSNFVKRLENVWSSVDGLDEPSLRLIETTDRSAYAAIVGSNMRLVDHLTGTLVQTWNYWQDSDGLSPTSVPANLRNFRRVTVPIGVLRFFTTALADRYSWMASIDGMVELVGNYFAAEPPQFGDQRRLLWGLRSAYVEELLAMLKPLGTSAASSVKSCTQALKGLPGATAALLAMHPELAPVVNDIVSGGERILEEGLTELDPTGGALAKRAVFYGEWLGLAAGANHLVTLAESKAFAAGLYTRFGILNPAKAMSSSARLLGARTLQLGGAVVRLAYFSSLNTLRSIPMTSKIPGSPITGGAALALPAMVYGHFQGEYTKARLQHVASTDDCQDLADPLYWKHRDRCERDFSSDATARLDCLTRARSLYKKEINACIEEFSASESWLFFD